VNLLRSIREKVYGVLVEDGSIALGSVAALLRSASGMHPPKPMRSCATWP